MSETRRRGQEFRPFPLRATFPTITTFPTRKIPKRMPPIERNPNSQAQDANIALSELLTLIEDYHAFNPDTTVPVYPYPTPLQFSQQVARGRPCVYRLDWDVLNDNAGAGTKGINGCDRGREVSDKTTNRGRGEVQKWEAPPTEQDHLDDEQRSILSAPCFGWTRKTLCDIVKEEVEIAATPDGRADSLYMLPRKRRQRSDQDYFDHDDKAPPPAINIDTDDGKDLKILPESSMTTTAGSTEPVFLQPATTSMTLSTLLSHICASSPLPNKRTPVFYLQSQNSNLMTSPLSSLLPQLPNGGTPPPFSAKVLGTPDATNIWIGNDESVTSTHRDPYENLYLVVKGKKKFVLYSPVEEICLHATDVRVGRWEYHHESSAETGEEWEIVMEGEDDGEEKDRGAMQEGDTPSQSISSTPASPSSSNSSPRIPWIPIDPLDPPSLSSQTYPYYKHARPLTVTVSEGEILYLPAGWFHHVTQECGQWEVKGEEGRTQEKEQAPCIAVNYWFDMEYSGEKYVMRELIGRLVGRVRNGQSPLKCEG